MEDQRESNEMNKRTWVKNNYSSKNLSNSAINSNCREVIIYAEIKSDAMTALPCSIIFWRMFETDFLIGLKT